MDSKLRVALIGGLVALVLLAVAVTTAAEEGANTAPPPGLVTVEVWSSADTYINQSQPGTNYGTSGTLVVGGNAYVQEARILLKFDLPSLPPDAVIDSASVQIHRVINQNVGAAVATPPPGQYIQTRPITSNWTEGGVTWSNQPTIAAPVDSSTYVPFSGEGYVYWNVTNSVANWVSGALTNRGLMLVSSSVGVGVQGFNAGAKLTISYLTSTPTATLTRTPTRTSTTAPTTTKTATPTATSACPLAEIPAEMDTYTDSSNPGAIEGLDARLFVARDGSAQKYTYLYFPFEGVVPPSEYIWDAKIKFTTDTVQGDQAGPWTIMAYGLAEPFNHGTTSWSNQPAIYGSLGWGEVSQTTYNYIDVTQLVRQWHAGAETNNGVVLVPVGPGDFSASFYSCQQAPAGAYCPKLVIGCGGVPPTATPTRTVTHTPTVTLTPTVTPTYTKVNVHPFPTDTSIEVTQGLQDLNNSVPLIEGKRTFVRFHVIGNDTSPQPDIKGYPATAELHVWHNGGYVATLSPINGVPGTPAQIYIKRNPFRSNLYSAYLFEIPTAYTNGALGLVAKVNPDEALDEKDYTDNEAQTQVSFVPAPPSIYFGIYRVSYQKEDGTTSIPSFDKVKEVLAWAEMVLPITSTPYFLRTMSCPTGYSMGGAAYDCPDFYGPLNVFLREKWLEDYWGGHPIFDNYGLVKYYGLVDERGGGLANGIPAAVASGGTNAWSTFTHEILHTLGRHHTPVCGAETGCWSGFCPDGFEYHPYGGGRISPTVFEYTDTTVFAFDTFGLWNKPYAIRNASTRDIMSYCIGNRWPSKFTYERILDYLNDHGATRASDAWNVEGAVAAEYLVVNGSIEPVRGELGLMPMYVLTAPSTLPRPPGGDYAIVLRDSHGGELRRHAFSPAAAASDGLCDGGTEEGTMTISELVRYDSRAVRVDIEGPRGILHTVTAGATPPDVTVRWPNGGEFVDGETVAVEWFARDTDGDPMTFNVEYSTDNGRTWEMVAAGLTETSTELPAVNLPASDRARIRVTASDGIHTTRDTSDTYFTVPNRPPLIEITEPAADAHVVVGHTLALVAFAYDVDTGSMPDEQISWQSSLAGPLGAGAAVVTTELDIGAHMITVTADDGEGGVSVDSVRVTVYGSAPELPPPVDRLWVNPPELAIHAAGGTGFTQMFVDNSGNPLSSIPWTAQANDGWIVLSSTSGTTPDMITVEVAPAGLDWGWHTGSVTVSRPGAPEDETTVTVTMLLEPINWFLPMIPKS